MTLSTDSIIVIIKCGYAKRFLSNVTKNQIKEVKTIKE